MEMDPIFKLHLSYMARMTGSSTSIPTKLLIEAVYGAVTKHILGLGTGGEGKIGEVIRKQ